MEPPSSSLTPSWKALTTDQLCQLIRKQSPRFQRRQYLRDETSLESFATTFNLDFEGDFCWSLCFSARFIRALCHEGFLPICCEFGRGTGLFVLLPKLHTMRCVLEFVDLHIPKKVRKRAHKYTMTVDNAFDEVMAGCLEQHGVSWLYPPLRDAFAKLAPPSRPPTEEHAMPAGADAEVAGTTSSRSAPTSSSAPNPPNASHEAAASLVGAAAAAAAAAESSASLPMSASAAHSSAARDPTFRGDPRMCSFALWLDGRLVAGEFGALVGCSYTSYSGFYRVDGAGAAQMALTARVLQQTGFHFWDMGQEHEYKLKQGATLLPRRAFLERYRRARVDANGLDAFVQSHGGRFRGSDLLQPHAASSLGQGI